MFVKKHEIQEIRPKTDENGHRPNLSRKFFRETRDTKNKQKKHISFCSMNIICLKLLNFDANYDHNVQINYDSLS